MDGAGKDGRRDNVVSVGMFLPFGQDDSIRVI